MIKQPKISVIIPVYNSEKYLERCIRSVLNQSYKNIEIVCVDDCSSDNSIQIIKTLKNEDKRIKLIQNKVNQGTGVSRNIGLKKAVGDWVLFCDNDDWYEKDLLKKIAYIILKKPELNIIEFRYCLSKNENDKYVADWLNRGKNGIRFVVDEDILLATALWNKCYKKDFLIKHELYEKQSDERISCGEIPFVITAFLLSKSFYYLNYIGYNWMQNDKSLSKNNKEKHWLSFFPMLKILKNTLIKHDVFNESLYNQFVVRILSWKLNTDIGTDYYKKYYKKTRKIFQKMKMKKADFKYEYDFIVFRNVIKHPYFLLFINKKIKGLI